MLRFTAVLVAIVTGLVIFAASATSAKASQIVYVCGDDLCSVDPDTQKSARITTDGNKTAYRYPSVSRDGKTVAAARGSDVMVGRYGANLTNSWTSERSINEVALSPDGKAVAESHSYVQNVNRFRCSPWGCGLVLVLEDFSASSFTPAGGSKEGRRGYPGGGGVGFLGNGALLSSYYTLERDDEPSHHTVCIVVNPAASEQTCEARIKHPQSLADPVGSPDSRLIAVAVGDPAPAETSSIQIFNAATGALVRQVATNGNSPSFSPDGRQLAYAGGDGWIHVVPTTGGKSRRIVRGHSPSWGGGGAAGGAAARGARVVGSNLSFRKGRIAVRVRCAAKSACVGTLQIRKGKALIGARNYRVRAGRTAAVVVRPNQRGRRVIAQAKRHRVTVQVKPRQGKATARKLVLRR